MSVTAEEVVRAAIAASVERFARHEHGVRTGHDPEDVHQARVATRRLRSDLRTFRRFCDTDWSEPLRAELRWFGGLLGAVRDAEVLLERLERHAARLPGPERECAQRVARRLLADRKAARHALVGAMASARYASLREQLDAAARAPRVTAAAHHDVDEAIRPLVRRRWKGIAARVDALHDALDDLRGAPGGPERADDDALHELRIAVKRMRYCVEAAAPVGGRRAKRFAAALAEVQDVLGEHRDAVVARQWLAKTAVECSPIEAYAVGMLAQVEWEAARAARAAFPKAWKAARRRELRSWL